MLNTIVSRTYVSKLFSLLAPVTIADSVQVMSKFFVLVATVALPEPPPPPVPLAELVRIHGAPIGFPHFDFVDGSLKFFSRPPHLHAGPPPEHVPIPWDQANRRTFQLSGPPASSVSIPWALLPRRTKLLQYQWCDLPNLAHYDDWLYWSWCVKDGT